MLSFHWMAYENQDILALLDSVPYEKRKDPTTARRIAELIASKAATKQSASIRFQEQSVELNERMFKPQMDQSVDQQVQQQPMQPQGAQPAPADVAGNPNIGELM